MGFQRRALGDLNMERRIMSITEEESGVHVDLEKFYYCFNCCFFFRLGFHSVVSPRTLLSSSSSSRAAEQLSIRQIALWQLWL